MLQCAWIVMICALRTQTTYLDFTGIKDFSDPLTRAGFLFQAPGFNSKHIFSNRARMPAPLQLHTAPSERSEVRL
nr:MAG TPA: hypothetical protein [Caudoviricetes sp.]